MDSMKILFDYQIFSLQKFGGISRYFNEISSRINQLKDCSATVFCPLSINHYLSQSNFGKSCHIPQIARTGRFISFFNRSATRIYTSVTQFDVIHKTYYHDHRHLGKKTVITVYDMIYELFPEFFPEGNKFRSYMHKAVKTSDAVICISHNTRSDLLKFVDVDPAKVYVTHLGYPALNSNTCIEKLISPEKPYVLYVGKRGGHKNFKQLVKGFGASKKLKNDFQILCLGDQPLSRKEIELIKDSGIDPGSIMHISGDDNILASAYRKASAFIYPSLYEGFGIPILEAMSCECPVVCSNNSSLPEVAGDAAEFFEPESAESICNALENVLYSNYRIEELRKSGLKRCDLFSWDRCAKETLDIYSSI